MTVFWYRMSRILLSPDQLDSDEPVKYAETEQHYTGVIAKRRAVGDLPGAGWALPETAWEMEKQSREDEALERSEEARAVLRGSS
jgi:hypothetical protein